MIQIDYEALDKLLSTRGISRRQLASKIGVSADTLAGSFRRKSRLKIDLVWKIADCLGIGALQLLPKDSEGKYDPDDYQRVRFGRTEYEAMVEDDTIRAIGEKLVLLNKSGIEQALSMITLLTEVPKYQKTEDEIAADQYRVAEKQLENFIRARYEPDHDTEEIFDSLQDEAAQGNESPF